MAMELRERAMLIGIKTSSIKTKVKDQRATDAVNGIFDARKAGDFYRRVIPLAFINPIGKVTREMYKYHRENTVPWDRGPDGTGLIGIDFVPAYQAKFRDCKARHTEVVKAVAKGYDAMIAGQRIANGDLFEREDIPPVEAFIASFSLDPIDPQSIENTDDLRVVLSEDEIKVVEENLLKALDRAVASTWERLYEGVKRLSKSLHQYYVDEEGKTHHGFHATAVDHLEELCDLLPTLNLTNDAKLDEMAAKIKSKLTAVSAPDLKANDSTREKVKKDADSLLESLQETLGGYN